jgi:hypothetical protein
MAKYGQLQPEDFFRADASGLGRDYALALAWIAQSEMEDVPAREFRRSVEKLRKIGIEMTIESVLGATLAARIRKNRYRSKSKDIAKTKDVPRDVAGDVPRDVAEDGTKDVAISSRSRNAPPTEKRAATPRYASSKSACLEQWNAAITEVTGTPSCVTGAAMATKAQQFHRVVYGNGETFADVVRRRRLNGQSLNLHWTMNDYANDIERSGPKTAKAQTQEEWFASVGIPHHSQVRR